MVSEVLLVTIRQGKYEKDEPKYTQVDNVTLLTGA